MRCRLRQRDLSIGTRLAACFATVMALMIVSDAVAVWQFRRMEASGERVRKADEALRAVVRVHVDIGTFRDRVATMANSQETREFASDTAALRERFLQDVEHAQRSVIASPELDENGMISSALETLRTTLPAQLDTVAELANAGDWTAIKLRLAHQIQDLRELSLGQVETVDQQLADAQSAALETTRQARGNLYLTAAVAALLTLFVSAVLGWHLNRSITVRLSELASGASALARGDFRTEVNVRGNDELAVLGRTFNQAARQLQQFYEELREQASLLSLTHDSIYVRDMNAIIRYWNRGAELLYGWSAEEAVGEGAHELLKTIFPAPLEQIETELLRNDRWEGELTQNRKDGTQVLVATRWSVKRDEGGAPVAILVTSNDISKRKRAEEALRESETRFRTFVDQAGDAIFVYDLELRTIVDVNKEACESLGYSRQEILGKAPLAFHLDSHEAEMASVAERAAAGETVFDTHWHRRKDGTLFPVEVHTSRVLYDGRQFLLMVARDIRDRLRAEEAIRQSEKQLREVIEGIPAIASTIRLDGSVEFINKRWRDYTGMSEEESVGSGWRSASHPKDIDDYVGKRSAALASGNPFEHEIRIRSKHGEFRWFLLRGVPLRDERGEIVRWYTTAMDIHDRKQAEERLQVENVVLREEIDKASMFEEVVGASPALATVLSAVSKVAPTDSTVLVTGETGTGKELIARAIHRKSGRSGRVFISINCAAIPPSLIASELFGHEKGAFTGALQRHLGKFELAEGGTIFLDEIGELPMETQVSLLRVLQEREIQRVGGAQPIRVNVRILAATNRDLHKAIAAGTFREDLFYRLNVVPVHVPPLRERKEDIPMLVEYFVDRFARKAGKNIRSIDKQSLDLLESYSWPGNIRELQNVVERSVVLCDTDTLRVDRSWLSLGDSASPASAKSLASKVHEQERELIERALAESGGKVSGPSGAAAKLGVSPSALEYKIRILKINKHQFKEYLRES